MRRQNALNTRISEAARLARALVVIAGAADTKGRTAAVRARKVEVKCIFDDDQGETARVR